jgi:uncharacterized protein
MSQEQNTTPVVTVEETKSENVNPNNNPKSNISTDSKNFALMAHLGGIFFGFVAPLIIYLVKSDDTFAKEEAKEALNFQIMIAIALTVGTMLIIVLIGLLIVPAIIIANVVFSIMAAVSVNDGKSYKYPVTIRFIK